MNNAWFGIGKDPSAVGLQVNASRRQCPRQKMHPHLQTHRPTLTLKYTNRLDTRLAARLRRPAGGEPVCIGVGGRCLTGKLGHKPPGVGVFFLRPRFGSHQRHRPGRTPAPGGDRQSERLLSVQWIDLQHPDRCGNRFEAQPHLLHDGQGSQGAHIELRQVVARHILHHPGSASRPRTRGHHGVHSEDCIANRSKPALARAAGGGGQRPPHGAPAVGGIQGKQPTLSLDLAVKLGQGRPGRDLHDPIGGIELHDPPQSAARKRDGDTPGRIAKIQLRSRPGHEHGFPAAGKNAETLGQFFAARRLHPGQQSTSARSLGRVQQSDTIGHHGSQAIDCSRGHFFAHSRGTSS